MEAKWCHLYHRPDTAIDRLPIETMKRILASLIVLFALFSTSCAQSKKEEKKADASVVVEMNKQMFLDKVFDYTTGATEWKYKGDKPAVIDFYATWCGPCKKIAPDIEALAEEFEGQVIVGKCDVDENDDLTSRFGVRNIPTVLFIKNGEVVDKQVGAAPKSAFADKIKAML